MSRPFLSVLRLCQEIPGNLSLSVLSRTRRLSPILAVPPVAVCLQSTGFSLGIASQFHASEQHFDARVPNRQKRLQRPSVVGQKHLDKWGSPIYRPKQDSAVNRCEPELVQPLPRYELRNRVVYPPVHELEEHYRQRGEEVPRIQPRFVCHSRRQIKACPKKLRFVAMMVQGMTVDEACKQLDFHPRQHALEIKETILEAVDVAVEEHGMEFRSNMYIADSRVVKGVHSKGIRKHAKARYGSVTYYYSHYGVMLVEGQPPKDFYPHDPNDLNKKMEDRLKELRARDIGWDYKWDRPDCGMRKT